MPITVRPPSTPHPRADYGTDWSRVLQRPTEVLEPTTSGPVEAVDLDSGSPTAGDTPDVPVWVHRMHGDGLLGRRAGLTAGNRSGSQRFIKRWKDVVDGY